MFFFRALTAASAFFLAVNPSFASPAPFQAGLVKYDTDLVTRADVTVLDIVTDLKGIADQILPEIEGLIKNNTLTQDLVMPLVNDLIGAIKNATSQLGSLDKTSIAVGGTMDGLTSASVDTSSLDVGSILLDIGGVLAGLVGALIAIVGGLLLLLLPILLPVVGLVVTLVVGLLGGLLGLLHL
ncbi:hypothetical protein IW261DRAFT_1422262 [Armillaria novae-zelandiae]|uniref:Uncharacterized protein n=1 Tax=Armillaria novae-zelandiae TaxID=153914 RepID=A0AA39P0T2_9AGAR|nr:hypothetical protein IW261DRAFT_1422262 [Armillaria novae-zelandiae]